MMLGDKKRALAIILGSAFPSPKEDGEKQDWVDKADGEDKEEKMYGVKASMNKFMEALKSEDVDKAVEAMREFVEMCDGSEYINNDEQ